MNYPDNGDRMVIMLAQDAEAWDPSLPDIETRLVLASGESPDFDSTTWILVRGDHSYLKESDVVIIEKAYTRGRMLWEVVKEE